MCKSISEIPGIRDVYYKTLQQHKNLKPVEVWYGAYDDTSFHDILSLFLLQYWHAFNSVISRIILYAVCVRGTCIR